MTGQVSSAYMIGEITCFGKKKSRFYFSPKKRAFLLRRQLNEWILKAGETELMRRH